VKIRPAISILAGLALLLATVQGTWAVLANAWHIPDNSSDLGFNLRNPEFEIGSNTTVTVYSGIQKSNNPYGPASASSPGVVLVNPSWIPVLNILNSSVLSWNSVAGKTISGYGARPTFPCPFPLWAASSMRRTAGQLHQLPGQRNALLPRSIYPVKSVVFATLPHKYAVAQIIPADILNGDQQ
jgi:hypothetical protein